MNAVPDLTPPGKSEKPKKEKKLKVVEENAKSEAETSGDVPKKERAPRSDYGYRPDAVITVNSGKDTSKIRGNVKNWHDRIKDFDGKTASEFIEANKSNEKDPPRGWLRHFAQNDYITLSGGTVKGAEVAKSEDTPPAA